MKKKSLKFLGLTLSLAMFLAVLGLARISTEDPPLKGERINTEYRIC